MREQSYWYKPAPRFFGQGDTYLGIELEVEAPDHDKKIAGLEAERNPNWCYAKHDGSLGPHGWEMVTHPISVNLWMTRQNVRDYHNLVPGTVLTGSYKGQTYTATVLSGGRVEWNGRVYGSISAAGRAIRGGKSTNGYQFFGLIPARGQTSPVVSFFRLVKKLRDLGYTSHNSGRCGMHLHVSRKAFDRSGSLRNPVFFLFKCLINGALFRRLSQRESFNYCQQEPVDMTNFERQSTRNSAVNITQQTVEVRIFRGSTREDRLRKNLEAVIAALEFSRDTATDYTQPTDQDFVLYVSQRSDRFPNLAAYITELQSQLASISAPVPGSGGQ